MKILLSIYGNEPFSLLRLFLERFFFANVWRYVRLQFTVAHFFHSRPLWSHSCRLRRSSSICLRVHIHSRKKIYIYFYKYLRPSSLSLSLLIWTVCFFASYLILQEFFFCFFIFGFGVGNLVFVCDSSQMDLCAPHLLAEWSGICGVYTPRGQVKHIGSENGISLTRKSPQRPPAHGDDGKPHSQAKVAQRLYSITGWHDNTQQELWFYTIFYYNIWKLKRYRIQLGILIESFVVVVDMLGGANAFVVRIPEWWWHRLCSIPSGFCLH